MSGPRLISVRAAAGQLGMPPWKVYEMVYAGRIGAVRLPAAGGRKRGALRIEQAAIDALAGRSQGEAQ